MRSGQPERTFFMTYHLAIANAAVLRHPFSHPEMSELATQIAPINELAENHPGFVWRLTHPSQKELEALLTYLQDAHFDHVFFNLSVWRTIEQLEDFTYQSSHRGVLQKKQAWIVPPTQPTYTLWWIEENQFPSVRETIRRLESIRDHGPTPRSFDFKSSFPPPAPQ